MLAGLRSYTIINYTPDMNLITLDSSGSYLYVEVTAGENDVLFKPNTYPEQGLADGGGIPVLANTTRIIPLRVYNFISSDVCTVVAYRT